MIVAEHARAALIRAMRGAADLVVAFGFGWFMFGRNVPALLVDDLGAAGVVWMIGITAGSAACGVLGIAYNPANPRPWLLVAAIAPHLVTATLLAGFGVASINPTTGLGITGAFAFATMINHLWRWRQITGQDLPAARFVIRTRAEDPA